MKTAKLLTEEYYVSKLSLAMQNDPAFMMQVHSAVSFLQNYDAQIMSFEQALQSLLYDVIINDNIPDEQYKYSDLLEKIAKCFNINRHFVIDFKDPITGMVDMSMKTKFETFNNVILSTRINKMSTSFDLTNDQMRLLIYVSIMHNSYDGTKEMLKKVYKNVSNMLAMHLGEINFVQITNTSISQGEIAFTNAHALLYMLHNFTTAQLNDPSVISDEDLQYFALFYAGLISIKSIGIYYEYNAINMQTALIWAPEDADADQNHSYKWDVQLWS